MGSGDLKSLRKDRVRVRGDEMLLGRGFRREGPERDSEPVDGLCRSHQAAGKQLQHLGDVKGGPGSFYSCSLQDLPRQVVLMRVVGRVKRSVFRIRDNAYSVDPIFGQAETEPAPCMYIVVCAFIQLLSSSVV